MSSAQASLESGSYERARRSSSEERLRFLGIARAEREAVGRTIQYVPPETWERMSRCPGWGNRDVLAHLAAQEVAAGQVVAGEPPVELDAFRADLGEEPFTVDAFNAAAVQARAEQPLRQIAKEWGRGADRFLSLSTVAPEDEWRSKRYPWLAGEIPLRYLVQSRVVEWWLHGEDIRAGAGMEPHFVDPPMYLVNDLAIRMLPWALGIAGLVLPGRSVRVDLGGAGGGTWHYGLAPHETPPERKRPDAYIEGRGYRFALVAGRRVPAAVYLEDGNLVVGGDEALAGAILEHVRAYV